MKRSCLIGINVFLACTLTTVAFAAGEDYGDFKSGKEEIIFESPLPAVKKVSFQLKGTEREKEQLNQLQNMIQKILDSSQRGIIRIPSAAGKQMTSENLEIVITVQSPDKNPQPYKVSITLQESGTVTDEAEIEPAFFGYYPAQQDKLYQELRIYLTKALDLQPLNKPSSVAP